MREVREESARDEIGKKSCFGKGEFEFQEHEQAGIQFVLARVFREHGSPLSTPSSNRRSRIAYVGLVLDTFAFAHTCSFSR
jgi:hypothetical protein